MSRINDQLQKAVFIDKDGTLIPDIPYNVNVDLISIDDETIEGLRLLKKEGFLLVVVSNQSGVARGIFEEKALKEVWAKITAILKPHDVTIDAFYHCPHHPEGIIKQYAAECECRKPQPGLLLQAANDLSIDLPASWMIGDILNDVEAGNRAGCSTILIDNGNETEWIINSLRTPHHTVKSFLEGARFISMQVAKPVRYE